ncbi:MAG TPA: AAA family ATPase [Solirubrobacterales bacterium]|nr:AAA family ATPase [Solirubrobacterales bacterium]
MGVTAPLLVGREEELRVIERAFEVVEGGGSRAVGVTGEPGIGKSRLLAEMAARASKRGHLAVGGRAAELERDVPFSLWVDALDEEVGRGGGELLAGVGDERLPDLAVALPVVSRVTGVEPAATGERHRVARAVRALLQQLAAAQPLSVLLDDVQWADPASAEVIGLLLHRLPEVGVLLALGARAGRVPVLEEAWHAAARHGTADVLELRPLSRDAVDSLLGHGVGPAAGARLYRESGGNPFFLQALAGAGEPATSHAQPALGALGVPRTVMMALAGEIGALDDGARLFVQGAAVVGDPFEASMAAAAGDVPPAEALEALDAVLAADLARPTDAPSRFGFRHPLVRRAVYEAAGGGWKLAAHARAAEALAARGASVAERAHHVARAAHPGDLAAVELLAQAGEQTARDAPATAAGWYATALRLLPGTPDHDARRVAFLQAQGAALAAAGRAVEARDVFRRLLAMLPADAAAERVAVAAVLGELEALWTNNAEGARRLLESERAALGDGEPGLSGALALVLARERAVHGDHAGAEALADEAQALACAAGDRALEGEAAATAADEAHCRLRRDDPDELASVDAKIAAAGALVDALPDERAAERPQTLFWLAVARVFTGTLKPAHAAAERGIGVVRASGQGLYVPAFVCVRGWIDAKLGRLDAAEADIEESLESALLSGNPQVAYWSSIASSRIALARGSVEEAIEHGEAAWERIGIIEYSQAGYTLADARLAAGDPNGALAVLEAFGWVQPALWTLDRLKMSDVAARVLLALGRLEEAEEFALRAPAEAGGRRTGISGGVIAHAQAHVLLAQGRPAQAAELALTGAAAAEEGDAALWAGRCRTLAGDALLADGRVDDARAELRRAATELEERGAWGYRDDALRVLRRLGERPRPARPAGRADGGVLASLTAREREVAALVAEGQTNAQVAARLHLSESTVEKHVSRVLAKLEVSTRAGVVRLLSRERPPLT